jgi:predicted phage-related endonuclease
MTITYYPEIEQGSDEWVKLRCGRLTASEMKLIITPTLKIADNDKTRCHAYELAAQRITGFVEPMFISDDMLRGKVDEIEAAQLYNKTYAELRRIGFITNDKWGFTIGYSPDGVVGDDGLIECKSRRQKYQFETILAHEMPDDYLIQVQTALLVSERKWCDFVTYCGGLPMLTKRIFPDEKIQAAIVLAATSFEGKLTDMLAKYKFRLASPEVRMIPTERKVYEMEIVV